MIDKVNTCPVCGSEAFVRAEYFRDEDSGNYEIMYHVECSTCTTQSYTYQYGEDAVSEWNKGNGWQSVPANTTCSGE